MKNAWVFLADGFEEVEAIFPIDALRRAGVEVSIVAAKGKEAVSSRGIRVVCDITATDVKAKSLPDCVVLPGGLPGSRNLAANPIVEDVVRRMFAEGRLVGAICAAPALALGSWGLLKGKTYTCYPGEDADLASKGTGKRLEIDGNLVTAKAAGVAEEFALALVARLCGEEAGKKVAAQIFAR
jgi:protein deglycase